MSRRTRPALSSLAAAAGLALLVPGAIVGQAPGPRDHHAMMPGPNGSLVLFGGSTGEYGNHTLHADTWTWDADGWYRAAETGPPPHSSVSMAYDSARAEVVLFGGWTDGGDLAGTWTWDGSSWTRRHVAGPGARSSAAMSWDPWSQRVILYGGCGDGDPADTWAWDGERWERLDGGASAQPGPANRCRATLAPLVRLGGLVLFGGVSGRGSGATRHGDLWLWREGAWTRLTVGGDAPEGRANHAMVRDAARDELIVFGGTPADRRVRADVWRFDGRRWRGGPDGIGEESDRPDGPSPREVAAMAWHEPTDRLVLHGGRDAVRRSLGDTWMLVDDAWAPADAWDYED